MKLNASLSLTALMLAAGLASCSPKPATPAGSETAAPVWKVLDNLKRPKAVMTMPRSMRMPASYSSAANTASWRST